MNDMNQYAKVRELEDLYRSSHFPKTKSDYITESKSGQLDNTCPLNLFVGTQDEITAETARRAKLAKDKYKLDYEEYTGAVLVPITDAIYKLTIADTPDNLKPAISKIYSMAYEDGHPAGFSEIYSNYQGLVSDLEDVLKLLNK